MNYYALDKEGFPVKGTAYYRIDKDFREFLEKCREEHDIVGFEYEGGFNFGVILGYKLDKK